MKIVREMEGDTFGHFHLTSKSKRLEEVKLLPPVFRRRLLP
jgi:hypothetical protein